MITSILFISVKEDWSINRKMYICLSHFHHLLTSKVCFIGVEIKPSNILEKLFHFQPKSWGS